MTQTVSVTELIKAAKLGQLKTSAQQSNQMWTMDFVADNLFDGRKLRMLTLVDCFTRESLAIHAGQSLKSEDVVRVVDAIARERGTPQTIKTDNGSEFFSLKQLMFALRLRDFRPHHFLRFRLPLMRFMTL